MCSVVAGSGEHKLDDFGRPGYSGLKTLIEKKQLQTLEISLLQA